MANPSIKNLTILQLNDLHGYLESHWEMVRETPEWSFKKLGGLARISHLFKKVRKDTPGAVVTLDNGDTFHGTYISTIEHGQSMIDIMNQLDFDAMTTHWEFAYEPAEVKKISKKLNYPMLGINPKSFSNFLKNYLVTFLSQKSQPMSFASAYRWS